MPGFLVLLVVWVVCGALGYRMMYSCDTKTQEKLCAGDYFVLGKPNPWLICVVIAPLALLVGFAALSELKKWKAANRKVD